jgi:hypothetical protein
LERRESSRLQAAKHLLLRSLRPGHSGWAQVSAPQQSPESNNSSAADSSGLDRKNPHYHSEGKGLRSKRKAWVSERELSTAPSTITGNKKGADRSQSFNSKKGGQRRLSLDDCEQVETCPNGGTNNSESIYENITPKKMNSKKGSNSAPASANNRRSNAEAINELVKMDRERGRRSFRKLTKDSGYETNYAESDYANLESLHPAQEVDDDVPAHVAADESCETTPRSRSPIW